MQKPANKLHLVNGGMIGINSKSCHYFVHIIAYMIVAAVANISFVCAA